MAGCALRSPHLRRIDLMILDAFSSDSIPIHLLTREAMQVYADRLTDDGVLAVHISNRVFDLEPVLAAAAADLGWRAVIGREAGADEGATPSAWVVLSPDDTAINRLLVTTGWLPIDDSRLIHWTDDYSSILSAAPLASLVAVLRHQLHRELLQEEADVGHDAAGL